MKSILNETTRREIISRVNALNEQSVAQWGKMNIYQMLKHCILCEEFYLGKTTHKRALLGRIIGKMALKNMLKDEQPIKPNAPTSTAYIVVEKQGNLEAAKQQWIGLINEYAHFKNDHFVHWFFGEMTREQVGQFVYKHTDHHLRQFNA